MSATHKTCVPPPPGQACAPVFASTPTAAGTLDPPRAAPNDHPGPEPRALEGRKLTAPLAKASCASPRSARRLSHTFPGPPHARARLPPTTPPGIRKSHRHKNLLLSKSATTCLLLRRSPIWYHQQIETGSCSMRRKLVFACLSGRPGRYVNHWPQFAPLHPLTRALALAPRPPPPHSVLVDQPLLAPRPAVQRRSEPQRAGRRRARGPRAVLHRDQPEQQPLAGGIAPQPWPSAVCNHRTASPSGARSRTMAWVGGNPEARPARGSPQPGPWVIPRRQTGRMRHQRWHRRRRRGVQRLRLGRRRGPRVASHAALPWLRRAEAVAARADRAADDACGLLPPATARAGPCRRRGGRARAAP